MAERESGLQRAVDSTDCYKLLFSKTKAFNYSLDAVFCSGF